MACLKSAAQSHTTQSQVFLHPVPNWTLNLLSFELCPPSASPIAEQRPAQRPLGGFRPHAVLGPQGQHLSLPQPLAYGSGRLRVVLIHSSSAGRSAGATVCSSCIIAWRAERNSILEQKPPPVKIRSAHAQAESCLHTRSDTAEPASLGSEILKPRPFLVFSRAPGEETLL